MTEPTREQIKKLWEWCGFKEVFSKELWRFERYKETNHWWSAPNGRRFDELPPVDLNNLFKYAVPKLLPKHDFSIYWVLDVDAQQGAWAISMSCRGYGKNGIIRLRDKDPALALFWAIWEVINDRAGIDGESNKDT